MAVNSKQFKENGTQFYPETHVEAVVDGNGTTLDSLLSGKQATLVSGTNIKTVNNNSLLGSGNIAISGAGTLNTNNTTAQSVNSSEALSGTVKLHKVAKTGTYSDLIGTPTIPTVNNSTITVQMNGATVDSFTTNASSAKTINLGGNYPKYVHLTDESQMPASPDSGTMYLIDGGGYTLPAASSSALGGVKIGYTQTGKNYPLALNNNNEAYVQFPYSIVYLTSESQMPAALTQIRCM